MKMKMFLFLLVVGLLNCNDTTTPDGIVRSAGQALAKGQDQKFLSYLTDDLRDQMTRGTALTDLKTALSQFAELKVEKPQLTSSDKKGNEYYTVDVLGKKANGEWKVSLNTDVLCWLERVDTYDRDRVIDYYYVRFCKIFGITYN